MPEHLQPVLYTAAAVVEGGGKAIAGLWTGGLMWTCLSLSRWAAAGGLAPTPRSCSPSAMRFAFSPRCGRSRPAGSWGCCSPPGRSWRLALSALTVPREAP